METSQLQPLSEYLARVPSIIAPIGTGINDDGLWWVKFQIDIYAVVCVPIKEII